MRDMGPDMPHDVRQLGRVVVAMLEAATKFRRAEMDSFINRG
jgi:hypothetical protein